MSEEAINKDPHDPNKGLNTRVFLMAVGAALVVILVVALVLVRANKNKEIPQATTAPAASGTSPQ